MAEPLRQLVERRPTFGFPRTMEEAHRNHIELLSAAAKRGGKEGLRKARRALGKRDLYFLMVDILGRPLDNSGDMGSDRWR